MTVCEKGKCTACGACVNICPKGCIAYKKDKFGSTVAIIDETMCVHCELCSVACPQIKEIKGREPQKCYAAWSLDNKTRKKSASGGIATEMYRTEAQSGGCFAGVKLTEEAEARFFLTDHISMVDSFQNSKYVYSNTGNVFRKIRFVLETNRSVTFVGLPCQVAGLKQYLRATKTNVSLLHTADLICHGVTPSDFLQQHIHALEKHYHKHATEVSFRDPGLCTCTFTFTLKEDGELFYQRKVYRNDVYQIGYHGGITYRENCYQCAFACLQRQGDITLADFSGVGKINPCSYDNKNVSCIMVNTEKGCEIVQKLQECGHIYLEERPLAEELNTEMQIKAPTQVPAERKKFLDEYRRTGDFEQSMKKAVRKRIIYNELKYYLQLDKIRCTLSRIVPCGLKQTMRRVLKG